MRAHDEGQPHHLSARIELLEFAADYWRKS
jgi:hypothetical protein